MHIEFLVHALLAGADALEPAAISKPMESQARTKQKTPEASREYVMKPESHIHARTHMSPRSEWRSATKRISNSLEGANHITPRPF